MLASSWGLQVHVTPTTHPLPAPVASDTCPPHPSPTCPCLRRTPPQASSQRPGAVRRLEPVRGTRRGRGDGRFARSRCYRRSPVRVQPSRPGSRPRPHSLRWPPCSTLTGLRPARTPASCVVLAGPRPVCPGQSSGRPGRPCLKATVTIKRAEARKTPKWRLARSVRRSRLGARLAACCRARRRGVNAGCVVRSLAQ